MLEKRGWFFDLNQKERVLATFLIKCLRTQWKVRIFASSKRKRQKI